MSPTDEVEVGNIITSMKATNSSGHDFISSKFIKSIQNSICKPLSIIFNKSFETGTSARKKTKWVITGLFPYYRLFRKLLRNWSIRGYIHFVKITTF